MLLNCAPGHLRVIGSDGSADWDQAISPSLSLLDYDASFPFDSMFPSSPNDTQPNTQEIDSQQSLAPPMPPATPAMNMNTTILTPLGIDIPLQNGAIGDLFYGMGQAPQTQHSRHMSVPSPTIIMQDEQAFNMPVPPGQYSDRDFINGGVNRICLQTSEELALSVAHVDLITKVSHGYNVQRPLVFGRNMTGVVALRWGIASICQPMGRNPPTEADLLVFLNQGLTRIRDGSAPQVRGDGIDRPLALEHLLMMLHRYGLRNNEAYNLGIIQPKSSHQLQFGEASTYIVTLEGARNDSSSSKTIWLYADGGEWFPLAPDAFTLSTRSYADVVKAPAARPSMQQGNQFMTTPPSSNDGRLLHPTFTTNLPPTPGTLRSSEAGSDHHACRSCGKKFDAHQDLTQHIRNHRHRSLSCPYCTRSFLWNKDLRRHMQTHRGKETRMDFVCPVLNCGKAYTRQDNLRRHHRQDHPGLPPLPPSSVTSSVSRHSRH